MLFSAQQSHSDDSAKKQINGFYVLDRPIHTSAQPIRSDSSVQHQRTSLCCELLFRTLNSAQGSVFLRLSKLQPKYGLTQEDLHSI